MGWKEHSGDCDRCGKPSKRLFPSFGKHICVECKNNRPRKGKGNAGVGVRPIVYHSAPSSKGVSLLRVPKSDGLFGKLFFSHYPGSKGIVGRALCYLVYDEGEFVGIIGASSPPRNYRKFREYFKTDDDNCFMNNNIFRLIMSKRNRGTRTLKQFRETIRRDHEDKYQDPLIGLITFVEPPRTGAVYKADNWTFLGYTQGKRMRRGPDWEKIFEPGTKKLIFAYKF